MFNKYSITALEKSGSTQLPEHTHKFSKHNEDIRYFPSGKTTQMVTKCLCYYGTVGYAKRGFATYPMHGPTQRGVPKFCPCHCIVSVGLVGLKFVSQNPKQLGSC